MPPPENPPGRTTAWTEGVRRLRTAATTEPGRLRIIGAALAALIVVFGAVTAWQVSDRSDAAASVVDHSQPLSAEAASIYRSLATANTTASSGFLAGGDEPRSVRERYELNVRTASELLASAAANSRGSASAQRQIAKLNRELPRYTGLVESARANNRQGLPLGGAYLRYANERMHEELLPAAKELYETETARLHQDYDDAKSWPWIALTLGVLTMAGLGWAQRRHYHRTNRVFNPGLLGATAATLVALLWLTAGHAFARSGLGESDEHGARSLHALNEAWIGSLQARGEENMWLVARGAGSEYDESYGKRMNAVAGSPKGEMGGQLAAALSRADDAQGRDPVDDAYESVKDWRKRHNEARAMEDSGRYDAAVDLVIQPKGSTGESFDEVDESLKKASEHEQAEFERAADDGRGALTWLAVGAAVLAVLGAAAALLGIGRRLSEYR
ncbi:hypothetical protein LHJ74_11345 [Streptomyces sp. N2-109]|uniref:Secreted protein n=1 Tax=Streptomyces gossypii TaxID=2883101 RepID=A0ABT2JRH6_9ACTN|nr:hypothetical protein [Streptomyces gossypii]MCT2590496.1 hypothetical protein [Streptomyces gossypii]